MKSTRVSRKKIQTVKELTDLVKNNKTVLIASIKNIPASQFQEISKKLRGKAVIKVPKKNLTIRVFDSLNEPELKRLNEKVDDSIAVIFSNLDPFDLSLELVQNRSPANAKPGQIAPEDIEISAGPTELAPGPAITELSTLGIPIMIEKGKISIKQSKVIAKKGEKISKGASEIMTKLDIKPFRVGFAPVAAFDIQNKKLYLEIKIEREETLLELKDKFSKALAFAVSISYLSRDTIGFMLAKATAQASRINRIMTGEPEPEASSVVASEKPEEKKEEKGEAGSSVEGLASLFG